VTCCLIANNINLSVQQNHAMAHVGIRQPPTTDVRFRIKSNARGIYCGEAAFWQVFIFYLGFSQPVSIFQCSKF